MNVTVIGTGYVGLVTGACLADMGNHVVGLDVDAHKIRALQAGCASRPTWPRPSRAARCC